MGEVDDAVTRSKRSVELAVDSMASVEQTFGQMKADADLDKALASARRSPAPATSSSDPHGSRQGEVQMDIVETPSEAPVSMTFMQMDVDEEELLQFGVIEPPDFVTSYDVPEEPLMHDLDRATLLSKQV
jgi:hypothetical protein